MFTASVWGELWGPEASFLDVSGGGKRNANGESDFLIWEMPHELKLGDRLAFQFEEGSVSSPKGAKFDPAATPPMEPTVEMSFPPSEADLERLEARPALNTALSWSIGVNGRIIQLAPELDHQHLSLRMHWTESRPERLRVCVSRNSLRKIASRSDGEQFFNEHVLLGSTIEIAIGHQGAVV